MSHIPKLLNAFSKLLSYPDEYTPQTAELLYVVLQGELPEAATEASQFGTFVEQHELWEVEEIFTRTFDVNPACALEVGWHLFGEEYARGMFLVRMREEMRKYGLAESVELPDHLSHVLAIVAAMPDDDATRFVVACVLPALEKMNEALVKIDTPYRHLVACLIATLRHAWGDASYTPRNAASNSETAPFESDPLRAFPVADVGCDCSSQCGGQAEFVPLEVNISSPSGPAPTSSKSEVSES